MATRGAGGALALRSAEAATALGTRSRRRAKRSRGVRVLKVTASRLK